MAQLMTSASERHTFLWSTDFDLMHPRKAYWEESHVFVRNCKGLPIQCEMDIGNGEWNLIAIVGQYSNGYFLCLPSRDTGCNLAGDLGDIAWNIPHLLQALPGDDTWIAWMIAYALLDYRNCRLLRTARYMVE